jgi:O-antigen ligase/Flp pilus assembly protein TadD
MKKKRQRNKRFSQQRPTYNFTFWAGWIEIAVYACLLFSVLWSFDVSLKSQFTLPKLLWLQTLLPAIALVWTIMAWRRVVVPLSSGILWAFLAWVGWWIFSTCFAVHIPTALYGMTGRYNGLWMQLMLAALFIFVATGVRESKKIERIIAILIGTLFPVAVYAVYQYFHMDPSWPERRMPSTIGHPVLLAAALGLVLPLLLAFMILARRKVWKSMAGALFILFAAADVATFSRGPWIGAVAGVLLMLGLIYLPERIRRRHILLTSVALLAILASGIVLDGVRGFPAVKRGLQLTRPGAYASFANRFAFYAAAASMVRDHPITGVGLESFGLLYPRYRPVEGPNFGVNVIPTMVHNGYLQAAVTTGIPGMLFYLALIGVVFVPLLKSVRRADWKRRVLGAGIAGSIGGYLVQDLTGWQEISLSLVFWIILGLAASFRAAEYQAPERQTESARIEMQPVWVRVASVLGLVVFVAVLALRSGTADELNADRLISRAETGDPNRDWLPMMRDMDEALGQSGDRASYFDRAVVVYIDRVARAGDMAAGDRAHTLLDQSQTLNPFNPYSFIHRMQLRTAVLQHEKTKSDSRNYDDIVAAAIQMDPNNSTVYEAAALLRRTEGRYREGLTLIDKALTLRPDVARYFVIRGDICFDLQTEHEALAAYRRAIERQEAGGEDWIMTKHKIITLLLRANDNNAANEEAKIVVSSAPSNGMSQALLGVSYEGLGRRDLARQAFNTAVALDAANKIALAGLQRLAAKPSN